MRTIETLAAAAAALFLIGGHALAQEHRRPLGVVELYTSQGCNSCPPADAAFSRLAARRDIVALSFHVDYWDYLGWRDTLASPANTERQRGYQRSFGSRSVYTPQAVVNGRKHVGAGQGQDVAALLSGLASSGEGMSVDVSAERVGDSMVISVGAADGELRKAHVMVAYFDAERTIEVERGENAGRSIRYANVVTSLQTVGMWHGSPMRLEVPVAAGPGGCAVLVQKMSRDGTPGPIIGAALMPLPAS